MLLSCVLPRVVYANNVPPHVPRPGTWGQRLDTITTLRKLCPRFFYSRHFASKCQIQRHQSLNITIQRHQSRRHFGSK